MFMMNVCSARLRQFILLCILTGCADGGEDAESLELLTRPGVPLELVHPAQLRVGSVDGAEAELLHDVAAPSLLPDGSIIVPMVTAREVRLFGPDGSFLRSLGKLGDGPGEFRNLRAAWARGDTIETWDAGANRVTRFLPEGDIVTVQVGDAEGRPMRLDEFVGALSDGWLITKMESWGWGQRDEMSVNRFGLDGMQIGDAVAHTSGMERYLTDSWGGPTPLSPAARFSVFSTSSREALYVAQTLAPEIHIFDFTLEAPRLMRWQPEQSWSPEDAFARVRGVVDEGRDQPFRDRGGIRYPGEWIHATSPPDEVPVFSDFLVDEEGLFWIRSYEPERDAVALGGNPGSLRTGPGGEWKIFTEDGQEVGSVVVPEGFVPYQVTTDKVVGIYYDGFGVEFVHVYNLNRS